MRTYMVREIRSIAIDSDGQHFEAACTGGRAKWLPESHVLSLKLHVIVPESGSEVVLGRLGTRNRIDCLTIGGVDSSGTHVVAQFLAFTPRTTELRSHTLAFDEPSTSDCFVDGVADDARFAEVTPG